MNKFQGSSVLVTGGNGAVGTNLVQKLIKNNTKVTVLDNFSQSKKSNLKSQKNLMIVSGDITNKKLLAKIFTKKYDYIFHLAARFANEMSVKNPLEDLRVNIEGTLLLLLYASKQKPERFLYTSSSSLYGPQKSNKMSEFLMPNPSTPYAVSKLTGEYYCNSIHKLYDLNFTVVRLSNSYGPFDPPGKFRNVIPNFFHAAIKNQNLVITGTGNETRDFTYVDDTVQGIFLAATKNNAKNEIFNLGTGKETKIKKLAELILKITKSNSKIIFKPRRSFDPIHHRRMDISKAKNMLNYNPKISIEKGLDKTFDWIKTI